MMTIFRSSLTDEQLAAVESGALSEQALRDAAARVQRMREELLALDGCSALSADELHGLRGELATLAARVHKMIRYSCQLSLELVK